jgi:hypothetical protein
VLQELGVLRTREARIILGAAVIDDVLGLILLDRPAAGDAATALAASSDRFRRSPSSASSPGQDARHRRFSVHLDDLEDVVPSTCPSC